MLKCGETNIGSKLVLKTEGQCRAKLPDLIWSCQREQREGGFCPISTSIGGYLHWDGEGSNATDSAWMMQSLKREKQHKWGMGYQRFGHCRSPVRLRGVSIHGCHLKYICMQSEGGERESKGREKGRERERHAAVLHAGAVRKRRPG